MITDFGIGSCDPSSLQHQSASAVDWIAAYLEWMEMEWTDRSRSAQAAGAANGELFVAAYFDWMDADLSSHESRPRRHAAAAADYRRVQDDGMTEPDACTGVDAVRLPLFTTV